MRVSSESIEAYQNIKLGKKQKYIVFCVNDSKTEIIVDKALSGKQIEKYNDFVDLLPQKEPRWAVYDFQFEADGGGQRNKLVLIKWYVSLKTVYAYSMIMSIKIVFVLSRTGSPMTRAFDRRCFTQGRTMNCESL